MKITKERLIAFEVFGLINSFLQEMIRHPYHAKAQRKNDIALIRLALPINFGETIRPACLETDVIDIDPTTELTQFGWGIENWLDRNGLFYPFIDIF